MHYALGTLWCIEKIGYPLKARHLVESIGYAACPFRLAAQGTRSEPSLPQQPFGDLPVAGKVDSQKIGGTN